MAAAPSRKRPAPPGDGDGDSGDGGDTRPYTANAFFNEMRDVMRTIHTHQSLKSDGKAALGVVEGEPVSAHVALLSHLDKARVRHRGISVDAILKQLPRPATDALFADFEASWRSYTWALNREVHDFIFRENTMFRGKFEARLASLKFSELFSDAHNIYWSKIPPITQRRLQASFELLDPDCTAEALLYAGKDPAAAYRAAKRGGGWAPAKYTQEDTSEYDAHWSKFSLMIDAWNNYHKHESALVVIDAQYRVYTAPTLVGIGDAIGAVVPPAPQPTETPTRGLFGFDDSKRSGPWRFMAPPRPTITGAAAASACADDNDTAPGETGGDREGIVSEHTEFIKKACPLDLASRIHQQRLLHRDVFVVLITEKPGYLPTFEMIRKTIDERQAELKKQNDKHVAIGYDEGRAAIIGEYYSNFRRVQLLNKLCLALGKARKLLDDEMKRSSTIRCMRTIRIAHGDLGKALFTTYTKAEKAQSVANLQTETEGKKWRDTYTEFVDMYITHTCAVYQNDLINIIRDEMKAARDKYPSLRDTKTAERYAFGRLRDMLGKIPDVQRDSTGIHAEMFDKRIRTICSECDPTLKEIATMLDHELTSIKTIRRSVTTSVAAIMSRAKADTNAWSLALEEKFPPDWKRWKVKKIIVAALLTEWGTRCVNLAANTPDGAHVNELSVWSNHLRDDRLAMLRSNGGDDGHDTTEIDLGEFMNVATYIACILHTYEASSSVGIVV